MVFERERGLRPVRTRAPMVQWSREQRRLGFRGGFGAVEGQKMAYSWFKTSLTSRHAGSRRDVTESSLAHVAT